LAIWSLGYPDESLERSSEALRLAGKVDHPFSLGWALIAATWFRQYRLEESAVEKQAESAIALAAEQGFPLWSAWATILRGWAMGARGRTTEGVKQIYEGLDFMRAVNAELARTHFLGLLAESYGRSGKRAEALTTLAEALRVVDKTGKRFYEAELYRLKGELLLIGHNLDVEGAENSYDTAIKMARKQSAKSWELRATTSLARLLRDTGRANEARSMLAEIYGWFTEGFDSKDLKEAKALLEELRSDRGATDEFQR
jgi:predicted ATPase